MGEKRYLVFMVERQKIKKSKQCDFSGIVSGTEGYLNARFIFSNEWEGTNKIALFKMLEEVKMVKVDRYGECEIPSEVLKTDSFKVGVIGERKEENGKRVRIKTDFVKVSQKVV